ncbi:MAG: hypothetical protein M1617_07170, partial [Actinobacteria bacterium]|nr:hypothetical protein [Actinomycetota bacterium]
PSDPTVTPKCGTPNLRILDTGSTIGARYLPRIHRSGQILVGNRLLAEKRAMEDPSDAPVGAAFGPVSYEWQDYSDR